MIAPGKNLLLFLFLSVGLSGCLGSLASSSHPPRYFQIDYAYQPTSCPAKSDESLRIWPLSAASPYDREDMIIRDTSQRVSFSSQFRWVTLPGNMIADMLQRDLSLSGLFVQTVMAGAPINTALQMGGRIFEFAWRQTGSSGHAVLDVEITLWRESAKRNLAFRKHYHLEGQPVASSDSEAFAVEMSKLVDKLSAELRGDLCATISQGSLSPSAG
jgi:ABC-type uncharacterized transport system auxiliary subunit